MRLPLSLGLRMSMNELLGLCFHPLGASTVMPPKATSSPGERVGLGGALDDFCCDCGDCLVSLSHIAQLTVAITSTTAMPVATASRILLSGLRLGSTAG